ncbi:hypothetical protein DN824_13045 [Stutzerimonas nosocomialis]|uniref:DUF6953 family protein n=1 Tax=Stutzerimonas nosocomialis TaxID=1056496 RepID=UPI00110965BD|nr:hypothetical protein DN824_13045 [Stutzerimonas nosocomialis]
MVAQLEREKLIYLDEVVDLLSNAKRDYLVSESSDSNLVIGKAVLAAFRKLTETIVVWVKPDRYWRFRVPED